MADGTALSILVTRARRKVNDELSKRFTEAMILDQMSHARRHVALVFGRIAEAGFFEKDSGELALAANAETLYLPADFIGMKVLDLVLDPSPGLGGDRIQATKLRRDQISDFRNRQPQAMPRGQPGYWVRRDPDPAKNLLFILPKSSSARVLRAVYHYRFADLPTTAGAEVIGVPYDFDELIVLYTAILLCGDDKKRVTPWQEQYTALEATRLTAIQGSEDETGTEQVSDDWHQEFSTGYSGYAS